MGPQLLDQEECFLNDNRQKIFESIE